MNTKKKNVTSLYVYDTYYVVISAGIMYLKIAHR